MRQGTSCRMRLARACTFGLLAAAAASGRARAENPPSAGAADSVRAFSWFALYHGQLAVSRNSQPFPWNDEADSAFVNDRLALLGRYHRDRLVDVFVKGTTGFRLRGDYQQTRFVLDEAHLGVDLMAEAAVARLFLREKVFREGNRLLELLSNDAPFISGRGQGLMLDLSAGRYLRARYFETVLRSREEVATYGGLPSFRGGTDGFRSLRAEARGGPRWHAATSFSQVRSTAYEDALIVESDVGLRVLGVDFLAELARSSLGGWSELADRSLFGLRLRDGNLDRPSSFLSQENAFAAEADLVTPLSGPFGEVGLTPGYLFVGDRFADPQGELLHGFSRTYANAWWRHPRYDAIASVEASDEAGEGFGECRRLLADFRARYRGGVAIREGILLRRGEKASVVLSVLSESALYRLETTARIDDPGGKGDLSVYTQGGMNVGARVTIKGALYLYRSRESVYNVELELRPRERFLMRVAIGSFGPAFEEAILGRACTLEPPFKERMFLLSARVWFGTL